MKTISVERSQHLVLGFFSRLSLSIATTSVPEENKMCPQRFGCLYLIVMALWRFLSCFDDVEAQEEVCVL